MHEDLREAELQRKEVPGGEAEAKPEGGQPLEGAENVDCWVLMPAALGQVHVAQWSLWPGQAKAGGNSGSVTC